jgi:hypothetical protein
VNEPPTVSAEEMASIRYWLTADDVCTSSDQRVREEKGWALLIEYDALRAKLAEAEEERDYLLSRVSPVPWTEK